MNVASLELCQELEQLSGWNPKTGKYWMKFANTDWQLVGAELTNEFEGGYPAYELGYLMRKLPSEVRDDQGRLYRLRGGKNQYYFYEYQLKDDRDVRWWSISPFASIPENAAAKLCIELFKQGVLTKEDK